MNIVYKKYVTLFLTMLMLLMLLKIENIYAVGEDFDSDTKIVIQYKKCTDSQNKINVSEKTEYTVQEGIKVIFSPVIFGGEIARVKYNGTTVKVWTRSRI